MISLPEPPGTEVSRQHRLALFAFLSCIGLYALHAAYAIATQRHLYGDASWFLISILSKGTVTHFYPDYWHIYYSRLVSYWITQGPTVAALHLGIHEPYVLSLIMGATYFGLKLLSLSLCFKLLDKERKAYVVFPLFALFAGTINSDIYIVTETHVAVSFLWPIAILLSKRDETTRITKFVACIAILASAFTYESWAFFGPMLMVVAYFNARTLRKERKRTIWLLATLLIFPTVVSWTSIIFPRDPTNKGVFISGLLKVISSITGNVSTWHLGALVSILAIIALAAILAAAYIANPRRLYGWIVLSIIPVLVAIPTLDLFIHHDGAEFIYSITDRGFSGLASQVAILAIYFTGMYLMPRALPRVLYPITSLLIALAVGQTANQLLATSTWSAAFKAASESVAAPALKGPVSCPAIDHFDRSESQVLPSEILCSWWATPLSILLAPNEHVQSLLISNATFQAFDPFSNDTLPHFAYGGPDYSVYLKSMKVAQRLYNGQHISFVTGDPHVVMLRQGFSYPEKWATWTDGERAQLQFCVAGSPAPKRLRLMFHVTPFLAAARAELRVMLILPGGSIVHWVFHNGKPQVLDMPVFIDSKDLSRSSCGTIVFHVLGSLQSPLELGLSNDPRHLGFALIGMDVTQASGD